jgi:hypothetical protein
MISNLLGNLSLDVLEIEFRLGNLGGRVFLKEKERKKIRKKVENGLKIREASLQAFRRRAVYLHRLVLPWAL